MAITISLLLFTSPVLVYYANNFIPNTASLGLVLIAWYLYANYYNRHHNSGLLAVGILPIWDLTADQISDHLRGIREQQNGVTSIKACIGFYW